MYLQVEKTKENKSRTIAPGKLHQAVNNGSKTMQLKIIQEKSLRQRLIQKINTTDAANVQYDNLADGDIGWGQNFTNNHIAADLPEARNKALVRAGGDHYAGRYTFMSQADLKNAIRALNGTYGPGDHNVQLQGVDYRWVTIFYGANQNQVNQSANANGNINISFNVDNQGYIRVFHMQDT